MRKIAILKPPAIHNMLFYTIGLFFLVLNKIKHSIQGYVSPRSFPITEFQKAVDYDFYVMENWMSFLRQYAPVNATLKDKIILELGPGADLGIGILTLADGAKKYNAIDVHNLVKNVPDRFYQELFSRIKNKDKKIDINFLKKQLQSTRDNKNDKINYICRKNFDLSIFKNEKIDFVFSQAAFEHFENVEKTISQLSAIVKSGTILIAEVDLKTHTRWIRDRDPLNIYRYSEFIYNLSRFSGSPNRIRPHEYKKILEQNNWTNIQILPLTTLDKNYVSKVQRTLQSRFRNQNTQMDYLSIMICAKKA